MPQKVFADKKKMIFEDIPDQAWFFYGDEWKKPMDCMMLRRIYEIERETGCIPGWGVNSTHAILTVTGELNDEFAKDFTIVDIKERLKALESRFNTYVNMMNRPDTHWDRASNRIIALDEVWDQIFLDNVWAQAYYYIGEPEYYKMCSLFGPKRIKHEPSREVINISSTVRTIVISDDDDVTSPVAKQPQPVSRKLFPEEDEAGEEDDAGEEDEAGFIPQKPPAQAGLGRMFLSWPSLASRNGPADNNSSASSSPFK